MAMGAALLLLAASAVTLVPANRIELSGRDVRIADVTGPDSAQGRLVIARLPIGRTSITISRTQLATLVRHALPGTAVEENGSGTILLAAPAAPIEPPQSCLELLAGRRAGEPILSSDVRPTACDGHPSELRFDSLSGANFAASDLPSGAIIRRVTLEAAPGVRRGQRLTLASSVGPVMIERPVTAVQAAKPRDRRIFVRTADGEILSAPLQAETLP